MKTLDHLKVGETARVGRVQAEGSSLRRRLLDMGLTRDTEVKLTRVAPLGDPSELEVRGYSLIIRKDDARLVEVA